MFSVTVMPKIITAAILSLPVAIGAFSVLHYRVAQVEVNQSNMVTIDVLREKMKNTELEIGHINKTVKRIDDKINALDKRSYQIKSQTDKILQAIKSR